MDGVLPLFPTALGETAHKDKVIEQVDEASAQLGPFCRRPMVATRWVDTPSGFLGLGT